MISSNQTKLVNKLEERGVIGKRRANVLRRLLGWLDSPTGRIMRRVLVSAIAKVINDALSGR